MELQYCFIKRKYGIIMNLYSFLSLRKKSVSIFTHSKTILTLISAMIEFNQRLRLVRMQWGTGNIVVVHSQ